MSSVFVQIYGMLKRKETLIVERVRAGLRRARAKGKRIGRPKKSVDPAQVASLRATGDSWRTIARKLGVSVGTVFAAAQGEISSISVEDPSQSENVSV